MSAKITSINPLAPSEKPWSFWEESDYKFEPVFSIGGIHPEGFIFKHHPTKTNLYDIYQFRVQITPYVSLNYLICEIAVDLLNNMAMNYEWGLKEHFSEKCDRVFSNETNESDRYFFAPLIHLICKKVNDFLSATIEANTSPALQHRWCFSDLDHLKKFTNGHKNYRESAYSYTKNIWRIKPITGFCFDSSRFKNDGRDSTEGLKSEFNARQGKSIFALPRCCPATYKIKELLGLDKNVFLEHYKLTDPHPLEFVQQCLGKGFWILAEEDLVYILRFKKQEFIEYMATYIKDVPPNSPELFPYHVRLYQDVLAFSEGNRRLAQSSYSNELI